MRTSSGSSPALALSSSIIDSIAKLACGWPGARIARLESVFVSTAALFVELFSKR